MSIIFAFFRALWSWITVIFPLLTWFFNSSLNLLKNVIQPLFSFIMNNWLRILLFWFFWWLALNLMWSLIAFIFYHISVALHLYLSWLVTATTVWIITNSVLWLLFLIVWVFSSRLIKW